MTLSRNLLAGLASSVWIALVGFAVVPLYLKFLGIEAYGLIGFLAMTQALLQILDLGLAPTINREVARCTATGSLDQAQTLLHTLATLYWGIAAVIAVATIALAPLIAAHWLTANHLSRDTVMHAVMLMGLVIACRWPVGLYLGALMGAQRLTTSSAISMVMGTLASGGAVAVIAWVSPTIEAFFIWQALVGVLHAAIMRRAAWRAIGRLPVTRFDRLALKKVWRFSAGMMAVAFSGLVFTQLDKLILSKFLSLGDFGRYALATVVVSSLYVLITPLFNAIYPRFSALVAIHDTAGLGDLYRLGTRLLGTILFPLAMLLAVYGGDLVQVWTGNTEIAAAVAPVIALLAIGSALHGVMHMPYALQLAYGMTRLPLTINAILMVILVPLIVSLATLFGGLGGAMAWFTLHVLYLLLGTTLTHRTLLKGLGGKWLLHDVGTPLVISALVGGFAFFYLRNMDGSIYLRLLGGATLAGLAALLSLAASPKLRAAVLAAVLNKIVPGKKTVDT